MSVTPGTHLGRYEIRTHLGAGGMGEVYLAQDTKLDRKVALKILPAEVAADRNRMNRFVQEAKAASALNHPNIITIHEVDEWGSNATVREGVHFIATEFIDGETPRERMRFAGIISAIAFYSKRRDYEERHTRPGNRFERMGNGHGGQRR